MPILHWLTREKDLAASAQAPYRLLEAVETYGDDDTPNMLIQGDNLDALKALLPFYAGKVKCIYIDPPYNTRSAFEHYDDNLEHTKWLSMMYPRLEILRDLLSEDGSIWLTLDDNESHYAKIIMDEIFGRSNFISTVIWQKKFSPQNDAKFIDADHDCIFLFAKDVSNLKFNLLERTPEMNSRYKNPDNDPRGPWMSDNALRKEYREYAYYEIVTPSGKKLLPPPGSSWRFNKEEYPRLLEENRLWFGMKGNGVPRIKRFLSAVKQGVIPKTIWPHAVAGHTQEAKKEVIAINKSDIFETPKPERLIQRVLKIATNPGDMVLDSFLGSGTTAAVAHKMGRRYIGIEMGEHAETHCIPRLQKVIEGEQGGISKDVGWKGGGGFRFYRLGEPVFDDSGTINPDIRFPALAAHIWFCETNTPLTDQSTFPLLGIHKGVAYYLLFNGILGDKTVNGGNVLTTPILKQLPEFDGPKVVYGEGCRFGVRRLKEENITFKHIPYDIKAR